MVTPCGINVLRHEEGVVRWRGQVERITCTICDATDGPNSPVFDDEGGEEPLPLDIELMEQCASWESTFEIPSSSGRGSYTVTMDGPEGTPSCTCPAFMYHNKNGDGCKHIEQVRHDGCFWHQLWGASQEHKGVCPECGGLTIAVKVAV